MKILFALLFAFAAAPPVFADGFKDLVSPDGTIRVKINYNKKLSYEVFYQNRQLVFPSTIDLILADGRLLSSSGGIKKISFAKNNSVIVSPVPEKRKNIPDVYNEMQIRFRSSFAVIFRAYNDGVAFRIATAFKDSLTITNEIAEFAFAPSASAYYSQVAGGREDIFHTSFEEEYHHKRLDSIDGTMLLFNPLVVATPGGPKVGITESDVDDYPGMFLSSPAPNILQGKFAPFPKAEKANIGEYSQVVVTARENFIARTAGTRSLPWRILMIAKEDRELPMNDMVYRLAAPSRVADVSWVHPMQSTDEWIITENLFNVDFKTGINTDTYKYYIDFAKKFGIESVMMDAGWSDNSDLFRINPNIDIEEIMRYAKLRGVRINMWTLAMTLDRQLEPALDRFNKWGVGFIMTDFIDRDDQKANRLFKRIAEACARHKIMIMFHGAPKPSGYNRTYPHAITREAVLGSEYNMWSYKATPKHNVTLPFTRMLAGPMDYEPGLLENGTQKTFRPIEGRVMSYGTRTNQLAMYVIYDSPIQFFSGNPSQGMQEPEFMTLLGSIPTIWDTTIVLKAAISEYIVTARKKDGDWYVGAMTDSVSRQFSIPLNFLDAGNEYVATACEDGLNADRYAPDYRITEKTVTAQDLLTFTMQPGGGYMVRLKTKTNRSQ